MIIMVRRTHRFLPWLPGEISQPLKGNVDSQLYLHRHANSASLTKKRNLKQRMKDCPTGDLVSGLVLW